MPLLGLLAAGAVKGGALGKLEAEEKKNSIFRDIIGQEIAHKYDMRKMEANASIAQGTAYYKNQLGIERDTARSGQRMEELKAKGEEQRNTNEARHGQQLEVENVRTGREMLKQNRSDARHSSSLGMQQQNLKLKAQDAELRKQKLEAQMEGGLFENTKAKTGVDKSLKMKNNSDINVDMF